MVVKRETRQPRRGTRRGLKEWIFLRGSEGVGIIIAGFRNVTPNDSSETATQSNCVKQISGEPSIKQEGRRMLRRVGTFRQKV